MDLDASRKAQLVVFIEQLLGLKPRVFPRGYIAHMVYHGKRGTYIYFTDWTRIVDSINIT